MTYGLFGSVEFGATPFSDLRSFSKNLDWLLYKLLEYRQYFGDVKEVDEFINQYQLETVNEAINLIIPTFYSLPDEELLEFREKRTDELTLFRKTIDELSEELQLLDLSKSSQKHTKTLIRTKLRPKISELEKVFDEKVKDMQKKRIENVILSTISLSAFAYLPFEAVILPIIMAYGKWASDEIGYFVEKMHGRKNGLYFLWDLNQKQNT